MSVLTRLPNFENRLVSLIQLQLVEIFTIYRIGKVFLSFSCTTCSTPSLMVNLESTRSRFREFVLLIGHIFIFYPLPLSARRFKANSHTLSVSAPFFFRYWEEQLHWSKDNRLKLTVHPTRTQLRTSSTNQLQFMSKPIPRYPHRHLPQLFSGSLKSSLTK